MNESNLKDSLDVEKDEDKNEIKKIDTNKKDRLQNDYQLSRAIDIILGINIYKQSLEEK